MQRFLVSAMAALAMAAVSHAQDFTVFRTPAEAPPAQLRRYLNGIGMERLGERVRALGQVTTREAMEARKKAVREKILRLVGGLPDYRGPLNVRQAGTLKHADYRIEKIVYESLPNFYVTWAPGLSRRG